MKRVKVTNIVKFCTLLLLSRGKSHGYEILKELEKRLGRKISASNVYPFLKTLEKNKLVEKGQKGKRKQYTLTSEGKKFVKDFFDRSNELIMLAIQPSISVCAHCGCKVFKGGIEEKVKGRKLVFCCKYCKASYK